MTANLPTAARPFAVPAPPSRNFTEFMRSVSVEVGTGIELRRGLATIEVGTLRARQKELMPALAGASSDKVRDVLAQCFSGFGFAPTVEEAVVIAAQYVTMLEGLPLWAIQQACGRFARGEVKPEEVNSKRPLDLRERPTTAQLAVVASDLVTPFAAEARRIHKMLVAPVQRKPTPDQRARADVAIEAWRKQSGVKTVERTEQDRADDTRRAEEADKRHRDMVIGQYRHHGLTPPEDRPGKALVSLPLLLSMGWRIEEVAGKNVLVQPPAPPPPAPKDEAAEATHRQMLHGFKQIARALPR